jgi:hypothetical protein
MWMAVRGAVGWLKGFEEVGARHRDIDESMSVPVFGAVPDAFLSWSAATWMLSASLFPNDVHVHVVLPAVSVVLPAVSVVLPAVSVVEPL